jgi:hypothetical protein
MLELLNRWTQFPHKSCYQILQVPWEIKKAKSSLGSFIQLSKIKAFVLPNNKNSTNRIVMVRWRLLVKKLTKTSGSKSDPPLFYIIVSTSPVSTSQFDIQMLFCENEIDIWHLLDVTNRRKLKTFKI